MNSAIEEELKRFTDLSEADLKWVAALSAEAEPFTAHIDIVKEGQPNEFLHVVVAGWSSRYRLLADASCQFPALLLPGTPAISTGCR